MIVGRKRDVEQQAEALGRAYARSIGKRYPMAPDVYGPGRQPRDKEAHYQRYYVAPVEPDTRQRLPVRVEMDAKAREFSGRDVVLTNGEIVVIRSPATRQQIEAEYVRAVAAGEITDTVRVDAPEEPVRGGR